jgi:UDPglucose--hexose-1-phosphate uridylyltransferase
MEGPHRRFNPLTGEWVLVSPDRTGRPWKGAIDPLYPVPLPDYDPSCYLCPGNQRAGGIRNPDYINPFVFTNDYAALYPDTPPATFEKGLLRAESQSGTCRVVCFDRRHNITLSNMDEEGIKRVIDVWADQTEELSERFQWVQVFENRGEMMGASNSHPHGQIWAGSAVPVEPSREDEQQMEYFATQGSRLLVDYARDESGGERVVVEDEDWLVVVPFWAVWPFETLLVAKAAAGHLPQLEESRRRTLASTLKGLLATYDRLFESSFPYSMGWHGTPFTGKPMDHWQLHAHFYPPLLRSSTIRKFMVGYELLSERQRDLTPEDAAARLRAVGLGG